MPCDSIVTMTLDLDKVHRVVLGEALTSLGFLARYEGQYWQRGSTDVQVLADGRVVVRSATAGMEAEIRRACSAVIVKAAAAKNGWSLRWTAAGKATAVKQTYGTR